MSEFNQSKYIQEFQKENYDRCIFNLPKGQKEVLKKHWKSKGYTSLNTYINDLIRKDMNEQEEEKNDINVNKNKGVIIGRDNNGTINMSIPKNKKND